ncbi:MAG: phenylalanine--tRNA ligase subunit beta, partial [Flavobacteriaceae bacterium]
RNHNLKLFEFGKTYHQLNPLREEHKHLSLMVTGNRTEDSWAIANRKSDFFYLKSIVENVLLRLGIEVEDSGVAENKIFTEGVVIRAQKRNLVEFGTIQKTILRMFDLKQEVLYADFNWDNIKDLAGKKDIVYKEIPKYPEVKRDFALLLDNAVTYKQVYELAQQTERKYLKEMRLFDVYTGSSLQKGKKSYAISFTLRDEKNTLTDKQIDKIMKNLQQRYEQVLKAELR